MNRDLRRRQDRQARIQKNKDRLAKSAGATTAPRAVTPAPVYHESAVDRIRGKWRLLAAGAAVLVIAAVLAWFFMFRDTVDTSALGVETFEDQGRDHLDPGETNPNYNSNPPTSGAHDPSPVAWGVYTAGLEPFPTNENLVHNLEHGGVVIYYDPSKLSADEQKALIEKGVFWVKDKRTKVVVVPWTGLKEGVAVATTAWTKLMELPALDMEKVTAFVDAFEGPGPENVPFTSPVIVPAGY